MLLIQINAKQFLFSLQIPGRSTDSPHNSSISMDFLGFAHFTGAHPFFSWLPLGRWVQEFSRRNPALAPAHSQLSPSTPSAPSLRPRCWQWDNAGHSLWILNINIKKPPTEGLCWSSQELHQCQAWAPLTGERERPELPVKGADWSQ